MECCVVSVSGWREVEANHPLKVGPDTTPRLACCCAVVDVVGVLLYITADATTLGAVQF